MSNPWTSGPWEVEDNEGYAGIAGWTVYGGAEGYTVALALGDVPSLAAEANARLIAAAPKMVEALEECADMAWVETEEIRFDFSMAFSIDYNFDGLESRRQEIHSCAGSYMIWPSRLGGNAKWSVYGGPDGGLWFEKFATIAEAKDCAVRALAKICPDHPAVVARAILARIRGKNGEK